MRAARAASAAGAPQTIALEPVYETASLGGYIRALRASDVAVDVLPFAAGVTVQDLVAARVPLVTLTADSAFARGTLSRVAWRSALAGAVLSKLGLAALVAHDERDFAAKFAALATSAPLRAAARARLAAAPRASAALMDADEAGAYAEAVATLAEEYAGGAAAMLAEVGR